MLPNWAIAIILAVGLFSLIADWQDWFIGTENDV